MRRSFSLVQGRAARKAQIMNGAVMIGLDAGRMDSAVPVALVAKVRLEAWLGKQDAAVRRWCKTAGFEAKPGQVLMQPGRDGSLARVLVGVDPADGLWAVGDLPSRLPPGRYKIEGSLGRAESDQVALGWALGRYGFQRYKKRGREMGQLVWPANADRARVEALVRGIFLVRDLINTPANDMGPADLADAARAVAHRHKAAVSVISGDKLLKRNYPLVHAVGRASARPPCLIDLKWGRASAPRLTLIGKGVCFDSGGLDLKSASGMLLMKKDMGGAALVLGLAEAIMARRLPVRLRVLVPAVENAVSGSAFRPLDIIRSRAGTTVEIGNTDAEGRLILADALADATSEKPDLIIDAATLTGAARVALGPDLPALFANDDRVADAILEAGSAESDPLWRLPLWRGYRKMLDSKVADINNVSDGSFAGAITAALFLETFVAKDRPWVHIDTMAWNPSARPGRPAGGEAQTLRALFRFLEDRYRT
jgi:leucyl aminopeptidase